MVTKYLVAASVKRALEARRNAGAAFANSLSERFRDSGVKTGWIAWSRSQTIDGSTCSWYCRKVEQQKSLHILAAVKTFV